MTGNLPLFLLTCKEDYMFKKILVLALTLVPCLSTISTVYAAEDSQSVPVVYHVNPVVTIKDWDATSTVRLEMGQKIREPSHIDKNGYRFLGWRDARTGAYWNFNNEINENITIIAEYEKLVVIDETPVPAQTDATKSEGLNTGVYVDATDLILLGGLALIVLVGCIMFKKMDRKNEEE